MALLDAPGTECSSSGVEASKSSVAHLKKPNSSQIIIIVWLIPVALKEKIRKLRVVLLP